MLISRYARRKYEFDAELFREDGQLLLTNFSAARRFAAQMSARRADPVPASDINAMALIDEVLRVLIRQYEMQNPGLMARALGYLQSGLSGGLDQVLLKFADEFPANPVYRGSLSAREYLSSTAKDGRAVQEKSIEDLMLIRVSNQNPAIGIYKELFDDAPLNTIGAYQNALTLLDRFFARQPGFGAKAGGGETLFDILTAPAKASPYSLEGQLRFIIDRWGFLFDRAFMLRLLRGMDFVREEVIRRTGAGGFGGSAPVLDYRGEPEYERFSPDRDWMPRTVLIAKNSYVWLEQLSRKHGRWVKTLDQIPDEELDILASRGFTGLWLIGLWERSRASLRIKQRMGQADAVASAYSLHSYEIAEDLGGWSALDHLRRRAWARGLRLAADMVPNHMGIDSTWVIEHPDWFLSVPNPPYPSYSFNSGNLSDDARVGIYLEDHYYDKSDAAVIFQRRDQYTGGVRYIYHGNDGTAFPWNDTAQLDYSKAEVREAVIQAILHVARNFPIIRFDAAMTLAKKHIQRLWFPEPGAGGAIPSRAEHGMTRSEFDAKIPNEFWREVVDRVAAEVPDTLLLAEAFWLMEGYFVRTLGMHRVYNSAFMHMLRDEDNDKYRQLIKNTLEFDPQILKRYVNFMNNPDEKTAVEQFGTGDKYFGTCMVMATLPGLPMFGHGQVEGFHEKYGMEFRTPKWDEQPDEGLIRGHEWKIFPLLHRRYLFADVEHYLLYDMYRANGRVDENVIAYSNCFGDPRLSESGRSLVIYHNKYAETRGWLKTSAAYLDKASGDLRQKSLGEGLGIPYEGYVIFKDYVTRLEYIRSCEELWNKGLYVELHAYQHHAFLDWRFVEDERWQVVHDALNGAGVESMAAQWEGMFGNKDEEIVVPSLPRRRKKKDTAQVKKPRKKVESGALRPKGVSKSRKKAKSGKKTGADKTKPAAKKSVRTKAALKKKPVVKKSAVKKAVKKTAIKTTAKKAAATKKVSIGKKDKPTVREIAQKTAGKKRSAGTKKKAVK